MGHQDLQCGHLRVFHLNWIVALQNVWGRWNYFFSFKKMGKSHDLPEATASVETGLGPRKPKS